MTQNITLHEKIKGQIIEAMRAKDAMTLETLRGLTSLFSYELISKKSSEQFIDDESALTLIKRSVNDRCVHTAFEVTPAAKVGRELFTVALLEV